MKRIVTTLALLAICASTSFAANALRISQVYGGGGSATAGPTYNVDYVEIFNSSSSAISLAGYTIEYGSAAGNWGSSSGNIFTFPAGATIQPCSYVLVVSGAPSAGGGSLGVTADYTMVINASATNGKVALFNAVNTNLACGSENAGTLLDKIAYGSANCAEGTAVAALSTTTGAVRNNGGLTDTDANNSDFTVVTAPTPRNSASAINPSCTVVPTRKSNWGAVKSIYR